MRITKTVRLPNQHTPLSIRALEPGEIEVFLYLYQASWCRRVWNQRLKLSHAALRYRLQLDDGTEKEYYISFFPGGALRNRLLGEFFKRPTFHPFHLDERDYIHADDGNLQHRDSCQTTIYRISPEGNDLNVQRLHARLKKVLSRGAGDVNEDTLFTNTMNVDDVAVPAVFTVGDGQGVPIAYYYPSSPPPGGPASSRLLFKLCACVGNPCASDCCCVPLILPYRHNCTSLIVDLLTHANVVTDLAARHVWGGVLTYGIFALSICYAMNEIIEFFGFIANGFDEHPTDEILGVGALIAAGIPSLFKLVSLGCEEPLLRDFLAKLWCCNAFAIPSYCNYFSAGLSLLCAGGLFLYRLLNSQPEIQNSLLDWLVSGIPYLFIASVALVWLLQNMISCARDWQNGCVRPEGLDTCLQRAYLLRSGDNRLAVDRSIVLPGDVEAQARSVPVRAALVFSGGVAVAAQQPAPASEAGREHAVL